MNQIITQEEISFIQELDSRMYSGNTLRSHASEEEIERFRLIKRNLKDLASYLSTIYNPDYGELEVTVSSGNPIAYGGTRLNRLWSGLFKGGTNKQYAAQISFVINTGLGCLDVGFYFGRASSHSLPPNERHEQEERLRLLGKVLFDSIQENETLEEQYNSLFDYGFHAITLSGRVSPHEWLSRIREEPRNSQIVYRLYPNENGQIEMTTIRLYVSMLAFLMGQIPNNGQQASPGVVKPLTPEQRAKQAERRALIGYNGELFVMKREEERLRKANVDPQKYLSHVALVSDHFGYDIHSVNEKMEKIFIEVKTTTREKTDPFSNRFFMSANEHRFYQENSSKYRLYRVFNIEGDNPEIEILDLNNLRIEPIGFVLEKNA